MTQIKINDVESMSCALALTNLLQQKIHQGKMMVKGKKLVLRGLVAAVVMSWGVGAFAGAATGGASEWTQLSNNWQLSAQYVKQGQQYLTQGRELTAALKNLDANPFSILGGESGKLMRDVGSLISRGAALGGSVQDLNRRLDQTYNTPASNTMAENFRLWGSASKDTLDGALRASGLRREQFQSDTDALKALYAETLQTGGAVAANQQLGKIGIRTIESIKELSSMINDQQAAMQTYMMGQNSKETAKQEDYEKQEAAAKLQRAEVLEIMKAAKQKQQAIK